MKQTGTRAAWTLLMLGIMAIPLSARGADTPVKTFWNYLFSKKPAATAPSVPASAKSMVPTVTPTKTASSTTSASKKKGIFPTVLGKNKNRPVPASSTPSVSAPQSAISVAAPNEDVLEDMSEEFQRNFAELTAENDGSGSDEVVIVDMSGSDSEIADTSQEILDALNGPNGEIRAESTEFSEVDALETLLDEDTWTLNAPQNHKKSAAKKSDGLEESTSTRRIGKLVESSRESLLNVETAGPQCVTVGSETEYCVTVRNTGTVTSEETRVMVSIPVWMSVLETSVERGTVAQKKLPLEGQVCLWELGTLKAAETQTLKLRIVPEQKAADSIQATWTNRQNSSRTTIQAEEPNLHVELLGAENLLRNQMSVLRLKVTNTGNCPAKEVAVRVTQTGTGTDLLERREMGELYPDEEKVVPIEFMPKKAGKIAFLSEALLDGTCVASTETRGEVSFAEIQITMAADRMVVDAEAACRVTIQNTGNAPAENLRLKAVLPAYLQCISNDVENLVQTDAEMLWTVPVLAAKEEKTFTFRVRPTSEGNASMTCHVTADHVDPTSGQTAVPAVAVATATMTLEIPDAAIPDRETACTVTLKNTGSLPIEDGKLYVFLANGLEPQAPAGGTITAANGIVTFDVSNLPAGETKTFSFTTTTRTAGNYSIRCQFRSDARHLDLIQQKMAMFR